MVPVVSGRPQTQAAGASHFGLSSSGVPESAIERYELPRGALKELEAIVAARTGRGDLEDSIALYERGQALKTHCDKN
jgi:exodeoxyribonuclease VII small subunit